jgi:hypothetical protein
MFRDLIAGARPSANVSTRCTGHRHGLVGANVPAAVFVIQWSFTAMLATA